MAQEVEEITPLRAAELAVSAKLLPGLQKTESPADILNRARNWGKDGAVTMPSGSRLRLEELFRK